MQDFKVIEIGLIQEGKFLEDANKDLRDVIRRLMAHVREHGVEATKGAKATLTIDITAIFGGVDESDYTIRTTLKQKLPGRPAHATKAVGEYRGGEQDLYVRSSGSTADEDARQLRFATKDGRPVDSPPLNEMTAAEKRMG